MPVAFLLMNQARLAGSKALAAGTEMRAPAGKPDAPDSASAAPAQFSLSSIDLKTILKKPLEPQAVSEVTDGRALESHRLVEDSGNSRMESHQALGSQA